tara:strand:- start:98 stop:442 length:345 start_codon:yes stop_codon:yes gene_type:complete
MKKTVLLLLISLLFQSCFSYTRALNFNAGAVEVNQEVKIYKKNGTEFKGKVLSIDEDQIAVLSNKTNQVVKVPLTDISGVQSKEFSEAKSFAIPLGILIAIPVLIIVALASISS